MQQEMTMQVPTETEEKVEQEPQAPQTKENEEVVPGFGIAIKLIQQSNNAVYMNNLLKIFLGHKPG